MAGLAIATSVLTVCLTSKGMLRSVPQHDEVQHLVIDAGSTDGTLDVLNAGIGLEVVRVPGLPLYEAWNLAIELARGGHALFLNADDELARGAIAAILSVLGRADQPDIVCGKAEIFRDGDGANSAKRYVIQRYERRELVGPDLTTFLFGAPVINAKVFAGTCFVSLADSIRPMRSLPTESSCCGSHSNTRRSGGAIRMCCCTRTGCTRAPRR